MPLFLQLRLPTPSLEVLLKFHFMSTRKSKSLRADRLRISQYNAGEMQYLQRRFPGVKAHSIYYAVRTYGPMRKAVVAWLKSRIAANTAK
jgi:hypothetical protein